MSQLRISKTLIGAAIAASLAVTFGASAIASDYYDSAPVTKVEPIRETIQVATPRRECRVEPVRREVESYSDGGGGYAKQSFTAEILGAVVGAGVGRQFGRGTGQDLATVAGAVLGASVGHDIKNHQRQKTQYVERRTVIENVEVCEEVTDYQTEERIMGYRVQYRYNGRLYWTQTDYEPGDTINVQVSVVPTS